MAWPAGPPGVHEICVVADPANNITESNETNNEACAPLEVLSLPDYVLVDPRPPGPIVVALSLPVSLAVGLGNRGGSAPNATSTLAFVNASMPSSPFSTVSVPPVPAGGTAGPFTVTWTSPASPGTYTVFATADYRNDVAESNETNNNITWTINVVTGPTSTLVVGTPNVTATTTYVTSTTPLSFSLLDPNGMGIRRTSYRIDGGTWVNYTATGGFTLTPGGERLLEWFSEDYAGNVESVRSARLRVDDTPPSTSIAVGSPKYLGAELYVTSTTSISLIAVDGGATPVGLARTEYRVDGGAWAPYASSVILMGVDGLKAIDYRSADLLGNMETVRALRVVLDNTAPQTAISPSAPPFPAGAYFTLSATDAGSGVSRAESRIDGGRWIRYMSFMVPEGTHAIGYRSVDNLGNVETERTLNVTVEMVVPVEPNQKPLVALAFSIILFAAGAWSSRRAPWKGEKGKRATLKALVVLTLPFVALEVGTGVVSLLTGVLSVPPVLGLGMAVDGTILVAGIAILVYRAGDQQGA